ncbi:DUF2249 domain-containing protein [Fodinibius saliphilus]|uniref:DUF2249 domain-containing protein n=1 Tax=Fodinibius saliphilus TaxID=1920650 RepID=UPI0011087C1B|nr:DUF2249 domain-containing protein [Fodinibius saliphilus]
MLQTEELDVRSLIPIKRHEKLLKLFKELPVGESFVFINDHDPKPLYYEFRSIYGDVVGWEYLQRDPEEWKVRVTRTQSSEARDTEGVSTLLDLRKADDKEGKYAVFHRYSMMLKGDTMEIIADKDPEVIRKIFKNKFEGEYDWSYQKDLPGEYVVHVTKREESDSTAGDITVVNKFDVRPHPPAKRHDLVFDAFDELKPGEAFVFINDHDPKPLYYQLEAESEDPFKWEYLSTMPKEWTVKVMKTEE